MVVGVVDTWWSEFCTVSVAIFDQFSTCINCDGIGLIIDFYL